MTERTDWEMILPIFFIISPESDFFTNVIISEPSIRLLKTSLLSLFRHQIVIYIYQITEPYRNISNGIIRYELDSIRLNQRCARFNFLSSDY